MGFTPAQVGQMTVWEFHAAYDGFCTFHGIKRTKRGTEMTDERARELGIKGF